MATSAQIAANRANAQKSTGPRSAEGKSASRLNALKHGASAASIVIPGEDPADYEALASDYQHDFTPKTPSERFHVDTMLRADWQKRRLLQVEADLHRTLLSESPGATLADALLSESKAARLLARVQRQIAALERTWYRAHTEIRRTRTRVNATPGDPLANEMARFQLEAELGLASFRRSRNPVLPDSPPAPDAAREWPPIDPTTGKPAFFVG